MLVEFNIQGPISDTRLGPWLSDDTPIIELQVLGVSGMFLMHLPDLSIIMAKKSI